jgi:hypothetical protein
MNVPAKQPKVSEILDSGNLVGDRRSDSVDRIHLANEPQFLLT